MFFVIGEGGGGSVVKIEDMIIQSCLQYPSCHA